MRPFLASAPPRKKKKKTAMTRTMLARIYVIGINAKKYFWKMEAAAKERNDLFKATAVTPHPSTILHYRVSHTVMDLGWVDFDLDVPPNLPKLFARYAQLTPLSRTGQTVA